MTSVWRLLLAIARLGVGALIVFHAGESILTYQGPDTTVAEALGYAVGYIGIYALLLAAGLWLLAKGVGDLRRGNPNAN